MVLNVAPSRIFNSEVVAVRPATALSSEVVAVRPSRTFISPVLAVTPSMMFSSAAVAVIDTPPMLNGVGIDTVPVNVGLRVLTDPSSWV